MVKDRKSGSKFDINEDSTYKNLPVSRLALEFLSKLIETDAITEDEVQKFMTMEYTGQLFSHTDCPVITDIRETNKGNDGYVKYRKRPLAFKGKDIYVTIRWFEENRTDLISWYGKHLGQVNKIR